MTQSDRVSRSVSVHSPHRLGVVLVAAGLGQRLGAGIPKALVQLSGVSLLERSIQTIVSLDMPGHLVVVAPTGHASAALNALDEATQQSGASWSTGVVPGGAERQDSVFNGLEAMPESVDVVLIHDVARPLTPAHVFTDVVHAVRERETSIIPVLPVTDTVKNITEDGRIVGTVDRTQLAFAQTPQGFPLEVLRAAFDNNAGHHTDDAALVQAAGFPVDTVPGSPLAHKLTTAADVHLLEWMLNSEER